MWGFFFFNWDLSFLIALYPTDLLAAFWQVHNAIFAFRLGFEVNGVSLHGCRSNK